VKGIYILKYKVCPTVLHKRPTHNSAEATEAATVQSLQRRRCEMTSGPAPAGRMP